MITSHSKTTAQTDGKSTAEEAKVKLSFRTEKRTEVQEVHRMIKNFSPDSDVVIQSFIKILSLIRETQFGEAFKELKQANAILKKLPKNTQNQNALAIIYYFIAECYKESKPLKMAVTFYIKALKHVPNTSYVAPLFLSQAALTNNKLGKHEEAKKYMLDAIKIWPANFYDRFRFGLIYFKKFNLTAEEIDELHELMTFWPEFQTITKRKRPASLTEKLEKSYKKGLRYIVNDKIDKGIDLLKDISPCVYYFLVLNNKKISNEVEMKISNYINTNVKICVDQINKGTLNKELFFNIINCCVLTNTTFLDHADDVDLALHLIHNALSTQVENTIRNFSINISVHKNFLNNIHGYCHLMRIAYPHKVEHAYYLEGILYQGEKKLELSNEMFSEFLKIFDSAQVRYLRSMNYLSLQKYDEALIDLDKAIEIDHDFSFQNEAKVTFKNLRQATLHKKMAFETQVPQKEKEVLAPENFNKFFHLLSKTEKPSEIIKKINESDEKKDPPKKLSKKEKKARHVGQSDLQIIKLLNSSIHTANSFEEKINELNEEKRWQEYEASVKHNPTEIVRQTKENLNQITAYVGNWKIESHKVKEYSDKLSHEEPTDAQKIISNESKSAMDKTFEAAKKRAEKIFEKARESQSFLNRIFSKLSAFKSKTKLTLTDIKNHSEKLNDLASTFKVYNLESRPSPAILRKANKNLEAIKDIEKKISDYDKDIKKETALFSLTHKECQLFDTKLTLSLVDETKRLMTRSEKSLIDLTALVTETRITAENIVSELHTLSEMLPIDLLRYSIEKEAKRIKAAEQKIISEAEDIDSQLKKLNPKQKSSPDEIEIADEKSREMVKMIGSTLAQAISETQHILLDIKRVEEKAKRFDKQFYGKTTTTPVYEPIKLTATPTYLEYLASEAKIISEALHDRALKNNRGAEYLEHIKSQVAAIDVIVKDSEKLLFEMTTDMEFTTICVSQECIKTNLDTVEKELQSILLIRDQCSAEIATDYIKLIKEEEIRAKAALWKLFQIAVKANYSLEVFSHSREGGDPSIKRNGLQMDLCLRGDEKEGRSHLHLCSVRDAKTLPPCHMYSPKNPHRKKRDHENKNISIKIISPEERIKTCKEVYHSIVSQFAKRKILTPTDQKVIIFTLRAALIDLALTAKFNQTFRNNVVYNMAGYFDIKYSLTQLLDALKEYISCVDQEARLSKDATTTLKDPLLISLLGTQLNQYLPHEYTEEDHYSKLKELVTFDSEHLIEKSSLKKTDKDFAKEALKNRVRDHALKSGNLHLRNLSYPEIRAYIKDHHPQARR